MLDLLNVKYFDIEAQFIYNRIVWFFDSCIYYDWCNKLRNVGKQLSHVRERMYRAFVSK